MKLPFIILSLGVAIVAVLLTVLGQSIWVCIVTLSYIAFAVGLNWRASKSGESIVESSTASVIKSPEETILNIIKTKGHAQRKDFLKTLDMSLTSLGRILDEMEKQGLIVQKGENKGSYYTLKSLDNI